MVAALGGPRMNTVLMSPLDVKEFFLVICFFTPGQVEPLTPAGSEQNGVAPHGEVKLI